MKSILNNNSNIATVLFFIVGVFITILTINAPIGDFGNYYYGSKLFVDTKFSVLDYQSIFHFNQQIASYGQHHYFENYIPVPPFSLLFYLPFTYFDWLIAKLLFNIISLVIFCFSLNRILKSIEVNSLFIYFLPALFIYPLYNNLLQGQSYLLITACLLEIYMFSEKEKYWEASLLLSLVISLKIFPLFILMFFLLTKKYKVAIYTFCFSLGLCVISLYVIGTDIVTYYFITVLPRLMDNEIIGPYYHGNQSIYTLLLNLFSFDEIQNPSVIINFKILVPFFESIVTAILFSIMIVLKKKRNLVFFGAVLICSVLIGRYNTTYGMLILIPFVVSIFAYQTPKVLSWVLLGCFILAVNIPTGRIIDFPIVLMFSRLIGLIIVCVLFCKINEVKINLKWFLIMVAPIFIFKYISFPVKPIHYFQIQNTQGILYDYEIRKDSIILLSTMGEYNLKEGFKLNGMATVDTSLIIENNCLYYRSKAIEASKDTKIKPFLYNDSIAVVLSDMNQAIGFYKFRCISLK